MKPTATYDGTATSGTQPRKNMTAMAKIVISMVSDELTTRGIDSVIPEYSDFGTWYG